MTRTQRVIGAVLMLAGVLVALGGSALAGSVLSGCGGQQVAAEQPARQRADVAEETRKVVRMAYNVAAVTLTAVADAQADWMKSINDGPAKPTEDQVAKAQKMVDALHAARDALDEARPWVEKGTGDPDGAKAKVVEALEALTIAAGLADTAGLKLKSALTEGVALTRTLLGVKS